MSTVNMDALIPRDDFVSEDTAAGGSPRQTISLSDLDKNGFFQNSLRKPDFQRETTHWKPEAVVDLIRAFLDGDLIPAVILWERGDETFVIDGAHRLSALLAWIRDDYGDGAESNAKFGAGLTDEQRKLADKTRKLVKKEIGTYAEFSGLVGHTVSDTTKARRLSAIGKRAVLIQWVTAATPEAAESSFFKINQAAQPIDPVERRLLQTRTAPNAIAARCIARGGKGHKYWGGFEQHVQDEIEEIGKEIYDILYKPPHSQPITSTDLPIAGQGYNALPFVFNLVGLANGLKLPNSLKAKKIEDPLPSDADGEQTIQFLKNVKNRLRKISSNDPASLGLHPLVYFYANSGVFLGTAFLASLEFVKKLEKQNKRIEFLKHRRRFEEYLHANKIFVSLTLSRLGGGSRSLYRLVDLYWEIFQGIVQDKTDRELFESFVVKDDFVHLKQVEIPSPNASGAPSKKGASRQSKSASFIREALKTSTKCAICGGALHTNSVTFDHMQDKKHGGNNHSDNLTPAHPYCNSVKDSLHED